MRKPDMSEPYKLEFIEMAKNVANYLGMDVLGISCITNMATGIQKVKHSHERVVETAKKASYDLCRWVEKFISNI